jgi:hypothetical protein
MSECTEHQCELLIDVVRGDGSGEEIEFCPFCVKDERDSYALKLDTLNKELSDALSLASFHRDHQIAAESRLRRAHAALKAVGDRLGEHYITPLEQTQLAYQCSKEWKSAAVMEARGDDIFELCPEPDCTLNEGHDGDCFKPPRVVERQRENTS